MAGHAVTFFDLPPGKYLSCFMDREKHGGVPFGSILYWDDLSEYRVTPNSGLSEGTVIAVAGIFMGFQSDEGNLIIMQIEGRQI